MSERLRPPVHLLKPRPRCPVCASVLDGASGIGEGEGEALVPGPGDVTVCAYCATILEFTATLELTKADPARLAAAGPEQRRHLRLAVEAVRRFRGGGNA